jgi:hypothetical protein
MPLSVGDVTNLGTINLSGANQTQIKFDGTLDNFGTIIQTGGGNFGLRSDNVSPTTLKVEAGGQYLLESDAGISNTGAGENVIFNAGIIRKTAGTGTSTILVPAQGYLNNTGTIEADSGTLYLNASTINQVSGNALNGGTWGALNGARLQFPSGTSVSTNAANVTLSGAGAAITALAGLATNNGTLTVGPGAVLNVAGNYMQTADGALNVQIGGTPASGQFGQVAVKGSATLAGAFNAGLVNGFGPGSGQDFKALRFASATGSFATLHAVAPFFTAVRNATSFDLVDSGMNAADLVTASITAPTTATAGQSISVTWQVSNPGSQAAVGNWQDRIYLSTTPAITVAAILLGSVLHGGGLSAGGLYTLA